MKSKKKKIRISYVLTSAFFIISLFGKSFTQRAYRCVHSKNSHKQTNICFESVVHICKFASFLHTYVRAYARVCTFVMCFRGKQKRHVRTKVLTRNKTFHLQQFAYNCFSETTFFIPRHLVVCTCYMFAKIFKPNGTWEYSAVMRWWISRRHKPITACAERSQSLHEGLLLPYWYGTTYQSILALPNEARSISA